MYDDLDPTSGTIENGHDPKNNIGTVLVYSFFKVHLTSGMYIYIYNLLPPCTQLFEGNPTFQGSGS